MGEDDQKSLKRFVQFVIGFSKTSAVAIIVTGIIVGQAWMAIGLVAVVLTAIGLTGIHQSTPQRRRKSSTIKKKVR